MVIPKPVKAAGLFCVLLLTLGIAAMARSPQPSEVKLRIFVDEEARRDQNWKMKTASLVAPVLAAFERECGLRLWAGEPEEWSSPNTACCLPDLAEKLEEETGSQGEPGIILGLTGQRMGLNDYAASLFEEGVMVVRVSARQEELIPALLHELGHLFGAVHVADPASVMFPIKNGRGFDSLNAQAVALHGGRSFGTFEEPLPKNRWAEAVEIYERIEMNNTLLISNRDSPFWTSRAVAPPKSPAVLNIRTADLRPEIGLYVMENVTARLARLDLDSGRIDRACEKTKALLEKQPDFVDIRGLLGEAYRRQGLLEKSVELQKEVLRREPRRYSALYNLGVAQAAMQDIAGAEASFRQALALKPTYVKARIDLGEILVRQGRAAEAEIEFSKAASGRPDSARAHANLAELLFRRKDMEAASREAESAVSLNPDLPEPYNVLGNVLLSGKRFEQAAEMYRKAIDRNPLYAAAYSNLGLAGLNLRLLEEAEKSFRKALEIDPSLAEAYAGLGNGLLRLNRNDESVAAIVRALELGYRSVQLHIDLGLAYLRLQRPDQAAAEAQKAISLDPDQASGYELLGQILMIQGQKTKASEMILKAREIKNREKKQP